MSELTLAALISAALLLALAVWVPFLHLCDGCVQKLRNRSPKPAKSGQSSEPHLVRRSF